jgi:hypothetical protein
MAADGVDFIDEDDAGGVLLALLEHVAHAAGADAHEHLHEVGAGNGEEGNVGLAGDGAGQQRLAGARRADQQTALRNLAAEALEFLRVLQELDDLLQLLLGLIDAGDVLERHAAGLLRQQARPRLAEAHGLAATRLHLAHEKDPYADQQQHREPVDEGVEDGVVAVRRDDVDLDVVRRQTLDQGRIVGRLGGRVLVRAVLPGDGIAVDGDFAHVAGVDRLKERRVGLLALRTAAGHAAEQVVERHQNNRDDDPEGQIFREVQGLRPFQRGPAPAHCAKRGQSPTHTSF